MQSATDSIRNGVLAVFDFDGTITKKDTFNDFIAWRFGRLRLILALLLITPLIFLYLVRLLPNHIPKGMLFRLFFRHKSHREFTEACGKYCAVRLNRLIRAEAATKIQWHLGQGHAVVIISASVLDWIEPWAKRNAIETVIATEIEIERGMLTGRFRSKNCYGSEKVNRLIAQYPDALDRIIYVYGDSYGDREMLAIATHPFYRKFD